MKTVGVIAGMSWESSAMYYQLLNQGVRARLGGLHSAKVILHSVDFAEIEPLQQQNRWDLAADYLVEVAMGLEQAGAELILLATNTMHKVADDIERSLTVPFVHIADSTAEAIVAAGLETVGLLGTRFTMEQAFYKERMQQRYGLKVLVPAAEQRQLMHDIIFQQLCLGQIESLARRQVVNMIEQLQRHGAEAVILGCTEIGLLIEPKQSPIKLFDSTVLHIEQALKLALQDV